MERWKERLESFLFPTAPDLWVTYLRVGLGLQVVLYTLSLRADWNFLFGGTEVGLNGRAFSEALLSTESPFVPRLGWFVELGSHIGLNEWTILSMVWWILLCAGAGLLVGLFSRASAIVAWLLHLCAAKSGGLVAYGVDNFMTIGLLYLMLSPLPDSCSLDRRWRGRKVPPKDRQVSGFLRRVLQIHLCLIYFFSGLAKSLGSGWWDGSNLWRALLRPLFIWPKRTRRTWLCLAIAMHLGIGVTMGMYLFALIMIVLNVAAFGPDFGYKQSEGVNVREEQTLR